MSRFPPQPRPCVPEDGSRFLQQSACFVRLHHQHFDQIPTQLLGDSSFTCSNSTFSSCSWILRTSRRWSVWAAACRRSCVLISLSITSRTSSTCTQLSSCYCTAIVTHQGTFHRNVTDLSSNFILQSCQGPLLQLSLFLKIAKSSHSTSEKVSSLRISLLCLA